MAAGLSLDEDKLEEFEQAFQQQVEKSLDTDDLQARLVTDGQLENHQLSMATAQLLRDGGPWGQMFPEPCFEGLFHIRQQRIVGEKHLKLALAHPSEPHREIDGICFNIDLEQWPNQAAQNVRCVYRLDINEYRGLEKLQLMVQFIEAIN